MHDANVAERHDWRIYAISNAIENMETSIAYKVDCALDELVRLGVFSAYWGSSFERNALCAEVAKLATQAVLSDGRCNLPDEVQWLHVEREGVK